MVNTSPLYFSRTRGLFRECFPGEKSEDPEKTAAPLGKHIQHNHTLGGRESKVTQGRRLLLWVSVAQSLFERERVQSYIDEDDGSPLSRYTSMRFIFIDFQVLAGLIDKDTQYCFFSLKFAQFFGPSALTAHTQKEIFAVDKLSFLISTFSAFSAIQRPDLLILGALWAKVERLSCYTKLARSATPLTRCQQKCHTAYIESTGSK